MNSPIGEKGRAYLDRLIAEAIERERDLDEFQVDLAMSLADRIGKFGDRTFMSAKQWDAVDRIADRLELPNSRDPSHGAGAEVQR